MGNTKTDPLADDVDSDIEPDDDAPMSDEVDTDEPDGDEPDDDDEDPDAAFLATLNEDQRARWDEQVEKLTKANGNAAKWRKRATGTKPPAGAPPVPGPPRSKAPAGTAVDRDTLLAELRAEMKAEATTTRVESEARSALRDAGLVVDPRNKSLQRKALDRAMRLLDLEGAEDSDDVEVAVDELKRTMPALFTTSRRVKPAGGGASGPKSGAGGGRRATGPGKIGTLFE